MHAQDSLPDGAGIRLAVDVGGTFTDTVLLAGARRYTSKVLTTPEAPENGVIQGVQELLASAGLTLAQVDLFILGTTLATNALIERKGARTALITTEGFRDLVEIGWEDRFAQYDIFLDKPAPLVPRYLRFGVPERIDGKGRTLLPLDEAAVAALVPQLLEAQVESVAVTLLHGYANPIHEQRIRAILGELAPRLWVSLSSEVCPEIREYERLSTTCANAYVQPQVAGYLERLRARVAALGLRSPLFLMTSGGAITNIEAGIAQPVRLVESGPAGGAVLSRRVAEQSGIARALSFDMGGTTAKICFIDDYQPQITRSFEFGRVHRHLKGSGLPIRIPVIEMVEIGAGGGSVARIDALGRVQVGPDSAGSDPGPASYGLGGAEPTVTDANAVLGVLDPARFAAGKVALQPELARRALQARIAPALEAAPEYAALAVAEIVTENMANAARVHASELGKTVEDYTLVAFGGAAPLHAAALARRLGIRRVVVPQSAGVGSALGFLWAPIAYQAVRSFYQRLDAFDADAANAVLEQLAGSARAIVAQAAPGHALAVQRLAYMRYAGQGHEIPVEVPAGALGSADAQVLAAAFEAAYAALYARTLPGNPVEVISWSVNVSTAAPRLDAAGTAAAAGTPARRAVAQGVRVVVEAGSGAARGIPVYERTVLPPGVAVDGPALVVEDETTTVVPAGFRFVLDGDGHLVLDAVEAAQAAAAVAEATAGAEVLQ
ncbi:methylhydantoinase [Cupriavidus sp. USMAHM13]|uniref:hydantoinase/oxoprolinase family protein n=1 Tax=Cupriavidus sp. USMAHM13 TaxID=1389192 RepID=UPI0008A68868|nr:hydantoinase/oxoprolinase family protein [Cupriavidus sp. USMAHM13]AOZ01564.1 methylhydantoinase [Cupriavidus sp. USMAHM13]